MVNCLMRAMPHAEMIAPSVEGLGYEFVGSIYHSQGKYSVLRVYIDSTNGINVDDCAAVSRQLSAVLDVEDPIRAKYSLEVSSPGADRPLFTFDHFQQFVGHRAKIKLHNVIEGTVENQRHFTGMIKALENDNVILETDEQEFNLPFADIEKANLIPEI